MKSLLNRTPENKYANIVYAGAGKGENIAALKLWTEGNIITIDPNTQASKLLKGHHPEVKHYTVALSVEDGEQKFYDYWPDSLSTLRDTVSLPNELKNAQLKCTRVVETRTLNSLLSEFNFDSDCNLLILSTNGFDLEIIHSLSNGELNCFSALIIKTEHKNIYHQSIEYIEELKSSLVSLDYYLSDIEHDTMFSSFTFFRDEGKKALKLGHDNLATRISLLELELSNKTTQLEGIKKSVSSREDEVVSRFSFLESRISSLTIENKELVESEGVLRAELGQVRDQVATASKQLELQKEKMQEKESAFEARAVLLEGEIKREQQCHLDCKQLLDNYKNQIECLEQRLLDKEKQLSNALLFNEKLSMEESVVEKLLSSVSKNIKEEILSARNNINWRIEKGLNNSVKQLESYIGVQNFLDTGELSMEYHGWPISSDIALFLLGKIKAENYDLIIEFGSGTSTKLFAQAVSQQVNIKEVGHQQKRLGQNRENSELVDISLDIPQRVLTFEHNKKYFDKTLASLRASGVEHLVNLVHASLIDFTCDGEPYLYYDCDKALQQVADIYDGRTAKILVLIDGPPGATGPLARLPAVTKLLNYLGNHRLDLVLDDYNRAEEKEIAERWKKTISSRFINYEEEIIPCEKGAWLCRVNV